MTLEILFVPLSTVVLQYVVLRTTGMVWQGRYNLPFVVVFVVLAVLPIAHRWGTPANAIFFVVAFVVMFGWALRVSWKYSLGIKTPWGFPKPPIDHYYASAMTLMGIGISRWLFVTRLFGGELTSIDGGAGGWAGSTDGPADEGSDGAAGDEGSDDGNLADRGGDHRFRGGDTNAPAGAGTASVSGGMNGLIGRTRGLGGGAGSARQEGPVWRRGSFAAGASLQGTVPSADEQARSRSTSAGNS